MTQRTKTSLHPAVHLNRLLQAVVDEDDQQPGFCVLCGTETYGVEVDGRAQLCPTCGSHSVYSAEELLYYLTAGGDPL